MSDDDLKKLAAMIAEILNKKQDGPRPRKVVIVRKGRA